MKTTRCTNFSNLFWKETLGVSDSSSVHQQEFFTVHTAVVYVIQVCWKFASRIRMELQFHPDPGIGNRHINKLRGISVFRKVVGKWRLAARSMGLDRLCGLVVRVSGYRYRGLGFDSRRYQIFWVAVGLERGPLSLVKSTEELLE